MIADDLKIHPASIFHHFPAKEMIVQDLIETVITGTFDVYREILSIGLSPSAALYETIWLDSYLTRTNAQELACVFYIPELRSGAIKTERNLEEMILDHYSSLIAAGMESGEFISVHSRTVADAIYSTCASMVVHSPEAQAPTEIQATDIATVFLRGLLDDPARLPEIQREASRFNLSPAKIKILG